MCPRIYNGRKSTEAWMVHNTALNFSMGTDITTYRIRIWRFGPGRGYVSTGIAEICSSSITGSDIHYRMLATMVLLTFLLKCCVMTQQEGIMQDGYTFAGTDQCQLPEYGPYSYINLYTRIKAVRPSTCNVVRNAFVHLIRAPHYSYSIMIENIINFLLCAMIYLSYVKLTIQLL